MPVVALILGYNGPVEDGEKVLAPARRFGRPVADLVGPMPYGARQTLLDEPNATHGLHRYWRSAFTEQISDRVIDVLVEDAASFSSPLSALIFFYMHGAATRVPADRDRVRGAAGAVGLRRHRAVDGRGPVRGAHRLGARALEPAGAAPRGQRLRQPSRRGRSTREGARLVRGELRPPASAQGVYDPTNLFRINANIPP